MLIFYVDDDRDDLDFFQEAIGFLDVDVKYFLSPVEMLAILDTTPQLPDFIFLDINMPVMDGYAVLEKLKSDNRFMNIPTVFLSTAANRFAIDKSWDSGADLYVKKAYSIPAIRNVVMKVLEIDWSSFKRTKEGFLAN